MTNTADWVRLTNRRFQLLQLYQTEPPLSRISSFSPYITAIAPYTGEIALARNPRKFVDRNVTVNGLLIVSQAGHRLHELHVGSSYHAFGGEIPNFSQITAEGIHFMHWIDEKLIVLGTDMKLYIVVSGRVEMKYSLDLDFEDDCYFVCASGFCSGIAFLFKTPTTLKCCLVTGFKDGESRCVCTWLSDISHFFTKDDIESITFDSEIGIHATVPPHKGQHFDITNVEVLLGFPEEISCGDSLIRVNTYSAERKFISQGPFLKFHSSPNQAYLGVISFNSDKNVFTLHIISTDTWQAIVSNPREGVPPDQVAWVGNEAVATYWSSETLQRERTSLLLLFDTKMNHIKFQFYGTAILSQEIDGLRVIESNKASFLQEVAKPLQDIFGIGAISSAEEVYSSYRNYENGDLMMLKNIRDIPNLSEAVETCLKAAAYEFNQAVQKDLIRAAKFGKSFFQCQGFNHDRFVSTCKTLRVLNAVRSSKYGIPLTFTQYLSLTPQGLIRNLISRQQHYFAMKICDYLEIHEEKTQILLHWARSKVLQEDCSEEEILESIKSKLSAYKGVVSFASIAAVAFRNAKETLAIELLRLEPLSGEQVPLLLRMKKYEAALERAIDSGETDLVYLVLLEMKQSHDKAGLAKIMENPHFSIARNLLISFSKEQNIDFLKTMFEVLQDYREAGNTFVYQALSTNDHLVKRKLLHRAHDMLSRDKASSDDAKIVENENRLLKIQEECDNAVKKELFTGLSLSDTLYQLIFFSCQYSEFSQLKQYVEMLRKEFKINDTHYWWIRVRALSKAHRWVELSEFASKKSPIGYRPFAEACLENGNETEAMKYIAMVNDVASKIELYCHPALENYEAAIQIAMAKKDIEQLKILYINCPEKYKLDIHQKIESLS